MCACVPCAVSSLAVCAEGDAGAARVMHSCLTIRSPLRTPKHRPALTALPAAASAACGVALFFFFYTPFPSLLPFPAVCGPHWSCVSAHPPWPCLHTHVGQELRAAAAAAAAVAAVRTSPLSLLLLLRCMSYR